MHITPSRNPTHFAPLLSIEELTAGITTYQILHRAWPADLQQIRLGLSLASRPPEHIAEITSVEIHEHDASGALYTFHFASGGITSLRINLK